LYSQSTSFAFKTIFASEEIINLLHQIEFCLNISHGGVKMSFHKSSHNLTVINDHDFSLASTTKIHLDNQATISFLIGKLYGFHISQNGKIDKTPPAFFIISSYNFLLPTG